MGDAAAIIAGRYRVDRELWHGPHSRSLLVTDLRNGRPCVLRRLAVAQASPETARRFEAQAAILARLDHPGLPRFIDGFFDGEGPARDRVLVTSYHPGESLDRLVEKGRALGEAQALALLRRLVPVLAYLHGFTPPLVHRSITATGIVVGPDGRPCLTSLDYAVVEPDTPDHPPAPPGPQELAQAAPEVYMGVPVPASDIYALGLAIIRGMTAESPASLLGESARARLREVLGVSEGFAALLSGMIEPSLERRYGDVKTLEADLARVGGLRLPSVERPTERAIEESRPRRRRRPVLLAAAALALAALALAAAAVWLRRPAKPELSMLVGPAPQPEGGTPPPAAEAGPSPGTAPSPPPAADPGTAPVAAPAPAPSDAAAPASAPGAEPAVAPSSDRGAPALPEPVAPAVPVAPAAVPAGAVAPVVVEGRLLLDGRPFVDATAPAPSFWFRNEATKTVVKPEVSVANGAFTVRNLPPGAYGMSVRIDLEQGNANIFPGDLNAWAGFTLAPGATATVDAHLRRIMRLLQPVDNNVVIRGWDTPCGAGSVLPGRIVFAWEPVDPAARYEVSIDRLQCDRGYASAGRIFVGSVTETWIKVDLPPSQEGECYSFRLAATKDKRPIGIMTTHGKTGLGWDLRFVVAGRQ